MNHLDKIFANKFLVFLGDSITYGFPGGPQSSWVSKLAGKIGAVPLNLGVNGDSTADMLQRLTPELEHPGVSHVHILGGANDAWMEHDPEYSRFCVEQMVQLCVERDIAPILGLPTPVCTSAGGSFFPFGLEGIVNWLDRHRAWLREYARAQSIPLIDYFTPLCQPGTKNGDPLYFIDEAHLGREGNTKMAMVALEALGHILG